jgi:hypothetical protein
MEPRRHHKTHWIGGYDGAPTAPISVARYWLYKFDNLGNDYANGRKYLKQPL